MVFGTLTTELVASGNEEHKLGSNLNEPPASEDLVTGYDLQVIPAMEITTLSDEAVSTPAQKRGRDIGITPSPKKFNIICKIITLQPESLGLVEESKNTTSDLQKETLTSFGKQEQEPKAG